MIQVVKEEQMADYNQFVVTITNDVKELLGDDYSVQIYKVVKNNSLELDSLVALKEGKNVAPNIYLKPYYEAYLQGTSMKELADRLCCIYWNCTNRKVNEDFSYTFEDMKSSIIYRLVNYDKNKKLLEKTPHIKFLDLAITFYCMVQEEDEWIGTIRISNDHMEMWQTSVNELYELASANTSKIFPYMMQAMDDVIKKILMDEFLQKNDDIFPEELFHQYFKDNDQQKQYSMFVLTNKKGINGATCILYKDVLHHFADQMKSDLYILPSSIHEMILIPANENEISSACLSEMVEEVNRTQVAEDEVLSNHVYFYSRKKNSIIM